MIDTTTEKPPAECWHINDERVAKGQGPQRIEPKAWSSLLDSNGRPYILRARRSRGIYFAEHCFLTEVDAAREAIELGYRLTVDEETRHRVRICALGKACALAVGLLKKVEA